MFAWPCGKNLLCQLYTIKMAYQQLRATGSGHCWLLR
jgi:hypothetical protein